jgi:hypothetical protein
VAGAETDGEPPAGAACPVVREQNQPDTGGVDELQLREVDDQQRR